MPWIRRRTRDAAEPPSERLPDLEFLALIQASMESYAPGVTDGSELKGNSLSSPHGGWAVGVAPPFHGGGRHYDLAALPDTSLQPDVPVLMDCVVAVGGDTARAADTWVHTAGAVMLELLDRTGHFADHAGPGHERGIPGWYSIASGAVGLGADPEESVRIQKALIEANVLHRIAATFTGELEGVLFNGVKIFYGGSAGKVQAEIRVNGERHEGASAALASLGLPVPTAFTMVRSYAVLLPLTDDGTPLYPPNHVNIAHPHRGAAGDAGAGDVGAGGNA